MTPLRHPSRSHRAAAIAPLLLVSCLMARDGHAATPAHAPLAASAPLDIGPQLADARSERDAAEAALEAARRVLMPGHLLDPLPGRLMAGVGELQAQYAEMERQAAGYRATLGDQHPTLKGAEEVLAALRGQILDGVKRAVATAQQDVSRSRAAVTTLERRARSAEATGSIAPPVPSPTPAALPALQAQASTPALEAQASTPALSAVVPPLPHATTRDAFPASHVAPATTMGRSLYRTLADVVPLALRHPWIAASAGFLAGGAALLVLAVLVRPRRRRAPALAPVRIEPAAPLEPMPAAHRPVLRPDTTVSTTPPSVAAVSPPPPVAAVPVLATLPLAAGDDPAAIRTWLDQHPDAVLARGAASVIATLAAAVGHATSGRIDVVVTAAAGAPEDHADAAALALAAAAADAGRRVLLVDGHSDPRLGQALAPDAAPAAVVELDDRLRNVLRVAVGGRVLALLTGDAEPSAGPPLARLPNLGGFDTIVIAGGPGSTAALSAGIALLVAPSGAAAEDLAAAARIAAGETGRPCGVLLVDITTVEAPSVESVEVHRQPEPFPARRRSGTEGASSRLGLRRTFDPIRRVATRTG